MKGKEESRANGFNGVHNSL